MTDDYRLILACRLSGQISDAAWQEHLSDPLFRVWVDHNTTAKTPRVGSNESASRRQPDGGVTHA